MSYWEEKLLLRWSGKKMIVAGLYLGGGGMAPLLLYIVFGPRNGNPIGLGLLAMLGVVVGALCIATGTIKVIVNALTKNKNK